MKKKLMNNWSLKLLSLAFAFFIWLSVVSYSNPISTYTISGIPVEFEHEELITERGLSVEVVGKQTATIAVTVNRETSARISADDFKAVADFQDMYQDTQVPVTVTCMTGKVSDSNIDLRTRSIEVKLESLTDVTVPITANVVTPLAMLRQIRRRYRCAHRNLWRIWFAVRLWMWMPVI